VIATVIDTLDRIWALWMRIWQCSYFCSWLSSSFRSWSASSSCTCTMAEPCRAACQAAPVRVTIARSRRFQARSGSASSIVSGRFFRVSRDRAVVPPPRQNDLRKRPVATHSPGSSGWCQLASWSEPSGSSLAASVDGTRNACGDRTASPKFSKFIFNRREPLPRRGSCGRVTPSGRN